MREGRKGVPGNTCLIEVRRRTCILQLYVIQSIYTSSRSIVTPARRSMCSALSLSLSLSSSLRAWLTLPPFPALAHSLHSASLSTQSLLHLILLTT